MSKLFVAVSLLAAVVVCAGHFSPEDYQAKLTAAGLSTEAAAGIVAIGERYRTQLEAARGNQTAAGALFDNINAETNVYIQTQSSADQAAYAAFVENKRAAWEAHQAPVSSA